MSGIIEIAGDYLEGGGQILRTASGLSVITQKPIHVFNIRAKRPNPGLKTQHLKGLEAVADLCGGKLEGAKLGSKEVWFYPKNDFKKEIDVDVETAGSTGLVLQSLMIASLICKEKLEININGGSVASQWSPPLIYVQKVLLPLLRKMGYNAEIHINCYGFYPSGGAKVKAIIYPCEKLKPINLTEQGFVEKIEGMSIATKHLIQPRVAERQKEIAEKILKEYGYRQIEIKHSYVDSISVGTCVVLWAKTTSGCILGSDALGEKGKPAEAVGGEAADKLLETIKSGSTVDEYLSDQILPYMALADGESSFLTSQITMHAKTNMWVIEKFLDVKFEIKNQEGKFLVSCKKKI